MVKNENNLDVIGSIIIGNKIRIIRGSVCENGMIYPWSDKGISWDFNCSSHKNVLYIKHKAAKL